MLQTALSTAERDILAMMGYVHLQYGRLEEALIVFEALERLAPDDAEVLRLLAYTRLLRGEAEGAIASADRLVRLLPAGPKRAAVHLIRARAHHHLGQGSEAAAALSRFLAEKGTRESP